MARADTETLLCIDDWARYMAIHPNAWNQVYNPTNPYAGACDRVWIQHGWLNQDTGAVIGREDVAIAIASAEEMIAHALGYWPAPRWTLAEEHKWPRPARGAQWQYPPIQLNWGYIIEGGQRTLTEILADEAVVYSDEDGDGVNEVATITITAAEMAAANAEPEEIMVCFDGETDDTWEIRCLDVTEDGAGNVTIVGWTSQFVDPDLWLVADEIDLSNAANFVATVDIYRRYNDPSQQCQVVWKGGGDGCSPAICEETCQTSCIGIDDPRLSIVRALPGTYAAGTWTSTSFAINRLPDAARFWYWSGALLQANGRIKPMMAEAIVRLANCYLVDEPCGCAQTKHRWERDTKEQDINTIDAALAHSAFGTAMAGAIFAWSVVKRQPPIARGGALT